ncbi:hypothetical protein M3Y99_00342900 [Aphelenchoides fujianensis]|nr:hypothetical protein M3Y99_00342900 [Aphelenchoides fujianensis]
MNVYVKDANGHAASPINGGIRGLFFSATLLKGGYNVSRQFNLRRHPIKQLNPYENPFLMAVKAVDPSTGEIKHRFFVNSSHHRIHIEICITQNIALAWGTLSDIPTRGKGTAKVGGIRSKVDCTVCNLPKESSFLIDSLHSTTPTPQKAESSEPKVEVPQEVGQKRKLAASGEPEVDEKRAKVDASGDAKPAGSQTPLQAALEHDRSNRLTEYVEPTTEVAEIVGHLVEDVGSKEDEEKFLCVDSAEATEEEMAALKRLYEETFGH